MSKHKREKLLFVETPLCESKLFCDQCRDTGTRGLMWRTAAAVATQVPSATTNFECPYGVSWSRGKPPAPTRSRGLGDTIEKMTKRVGIKPCGGCIKRRDWLNGKFPYVKAR